MLTHIIRFPIYYFVLIGLLYSTLLPAQDEIQSAQVKSHTIFLKKGTPVIEIKTLKMVTLPSDAYLKALKGFDEDNFTSILDQNNVVVYKVDFKYVKQNNNITDMREVPHQFSLNFNKDETVYTHYTDSSLIFKAATGIGTTLYTPLDSIVINSSNNYAFYSDLLLNLYLKWRYPLQLGFVYEYNYGIINALKSHFSFINNYVGLNLRYPILIDEHYSYLIGLSFCESITNKLTNDQTKASYEFDSQKMGTFFEFLIKTNSTDVSLSLNYFREWFYPQFFSNRSTNNIILFNIGLETAWNL